MQMEEEEEGGRGGGGGEGGGVTGIAAAFCLNSQLIATLRGKESACSGDCWSCLQNTDERKGAMTEHALTIPTCT